MARIYLDHNATMPLRAEARAAMVAAMDLVGNPSSVHGEGRAAKALVERARAQVAEAFGCNPAEVVFTSGATEAASLLSSFGGVSVDSTAHDAIFSHHNGGNDVVAAGFANGETGVIGALPKRVDGLWTFDDISGATYTGRLAMIDATQAFGRVPFAFGWSGIEMAVVSAHKLGGPKGVGALILRDNVDTPSLQRGGGQEMGRRSGTENILGIAGFGAAAAAAAHDLASGRWDEAAQLRDLLEDAIADADQDTIFVGKDLPRLPNTTNMLSPGWKGETQVMVMDLSGFAVSAGSACSSGKVRSSRVLKAMGFDETAAGSAIRVSLGLDTTRDDVLRFAAAWASKRKSAKSRAA